MFTLHSNSMWAKPVRSFTLHSKRKPNWKDNDLAKSLCTWKKIGELSKQLNDADHIREMGDKDEMGSLIVNPIILRSENDRVNIVIDAWWFNSVKDLANNSRPWEPARVNGESFSVSDLICAYHQVPLSGETHKQNDFIRERQNTYIRGFYGLCGFPNFFSRLMTIQFDPLIKKEQATPYIDFIMQSQNKNKFTFMKKKSIVSGKPATKPLPRKPSSS